MERTLILVKPDAFARNLTGEILARFERKGLRIIAMRLLTMDRAIRLAIGLGLPPAAVLAMASRSPAKKLGLSDRGLLAPGAKGDVVWLDAQWRVKATAREGVVVAAAGAHGA